MKRCGKRAYRKLFLAKFKIEPPRTRTAPCLLFLWFEVFAIFFANSKCFTLFTYMGLVGLEPTTLGLKIPCSTN